MKKSYLKFLLVLSLISTISFSIFTAQPKNFNGGWKFIKNDQPGTEQEVDYDDSSWASVNLPHSVNIEPLIVTHLWQGEAWYRKSFKIDSNAAGKKIFLKFGAVMQSAQVYINGTLKKTNDGGYLPFIVDITNEAQIGGQNVIAVKADNRDNGLIPPGKPNGNLDFLYYGGIYRNVELIITDKLHITDPNHENKTASGGIFVTYNHVTGSSATVTIKTHVRNEYSASQTFNIENRIKDASGSIIKTITLSDRNLASGADEQYSQITTIDNPHLWDMHNPYLYTLESRIKKGDTVIDTVKTKIGIRTISFKADGFRINGKKIYLRGVNRHQEYPYIGNAVSNAAQYRDAKKIKEAGFNYVRTSHYPQSEAFLDACDELGIVVMNCIAGWQYFSNNTTFKEHCYQNMREMVRRDRNRPSIVLWEASLNESGGDSGFWNTMHNTVHQEYPTGNVYTCGWKTGYFDVFIKARQHGSLVNFGSACLVSEYGDWEYGGGNSSSRISRGDGEAAQLTQAFNFQQAHNDNFNGDGAGDGLWVMYDYNRGYSHDIEKSGPMDIFRLPKFSYYFYQSQRDASKYGAMVYIASHWDTGSSATVRVFSNCEQVALYKNNTLVATQLPDTGTNNENLAHPPFTFNTGGYAPGSLRAEGYIGGSKVAEYSINTADNPVKLKIRFDTSGKDLVADGRDSIFVYAEILDSNNQIVTDATNHVTFSVTSGDSTLINPSINAEAGIAASLLQAGLMAGNVTVKATANGLTADTASLTCIASDIDSPVPFARGADIGWLSQLEDRNVVWQNDSGMQQDPLQILKDHGINSVRLRVFVNPPANFEWQKTATERVLLGFSDKNNVVAMAKRAKNMGLNIMIDFHYSDHFADPAYQDKPAAWAGHTVAQLKADVYQHTHEVMSALAAVNIYPQWVQVGNEIYNGILWPEGHRSNFANLVEFLNSGYAAVKAVSPSSKVVTHLEGGIHNDRFLSFFNDFFNTYNGKTDVIACSYYPYWDKETDYTKNIDRLALNLRDMALRFDKEVMVVETGNPEGEPIETFNQIRAVINVVKAVPNHKGAGVFYWEPEANSSVLPDQYSLGATAKISTNVLQFTQAIDGFSQQNNPGNLAINKTSTASSEETSRGNTADKGNDGLITTRWCAANGHLNEWWQVDLGAVYPLSGTKVHFEKAENIRYLISVSTDGTNYQTVVDQSATTSTTQIRRDNFSASARYVKITYTSLPVNTWASHFEFEVYEETAGATDIIPYLQINSGTPQQTNSAAVDVGDQLKLSPKPETNGTWSWTGPNGFSAVTREVTLTTIQSNQAGEYVAKYINTSGLESYERFKIIVTGNNLIVNSGFETGVLSPWTVWNSAVINNSHARTGTYCGAVTSDAGSLEQVITGLKANTTYQLTGYVQLSSSDCIVYIGVKDFGGAEKNVRTGATGSYSKATITFTTGSTNTSAKIYLWKESGSSPVYGDDFTVY